MAMGLAAGVLGWTPFGYLSTGIAREGDHMAKQPQTIVITGASGGIGSELALAYAAPGRRLALLARNRHKLETLALRCSDAGAHVHLVTMDVRDRLALRRTLQAFDDQYPVDLLIANAGITCGVAPSSGLEDPEEAHRLTEVNYTAAVEAAEAVLPGMRARNCGQIVFLSSLAGLRALPDMPSYSATKAAVAAYGAALRGQLRGTGIHVSVVFPGFVTSAMSQRHQGPKPLEISAVRASKKIVKGIQRRRSVIAFPKVLVGLIWLQKTFLIPRLSDWTMSWFPARIDPDPSYNAISEPDQAHKTVKPQGGEGEANKKPASTMPAGF